MSHMFIYNKLDRADKLQCTIGVFFNRRFVLRSKVLYMGVTMQKVFFLRHCSTWVLVGCQVLNENQESGPNYNYIVGATTMTLKL